MVWEGDELIAIAPNVNPATRELGFDKRNYHGDFGFFDQSKRKPRGTWVFPFFTEEKLLLEILLLGSGDLCFDQITTDSKDLKKL